MNALTTVVSPGTGLALIPTNMRDAMDLANMMSRGKLVPQALQNSPADCLLVIEQAARWGMSPFAVAQEVSVIQGKLMHSGKIVAAALQSCGILSSRLRYDYEGAGDDLAVVVTGTLRGETESRSVRVRLRDARTSNQHWGKSPEQMLAYHAARVWARRYAPEVMLGVYSPEEMEPAAETIPPARGPVVDAAAEIVAERAPAPAAAPWAGMQWPICDRRGNCADMGDPAAWLEELQKRVAHIQGLGTLDDATKRKTIQQIADANRDAWADVRARGYGGVVDEVEALFRAALGEG